MTDSEGNADEKVKPKPDNLDDDCEVSDFSSYLYVLAIILW